MSAKGPTEAQILESLRHIYTGGLVIGTSHARNMLAKGNLISKHQAPFGRNSLWLLTKAGRAQLAEMDREAAKALVRPNNSPRN